MQLPSILATLALALFGNLAGADDTASTLAEPATLYNSNGQSAQWTGVGRLVSQNKHCIGTLLDSSDAATDPDPIGPEPGVHYLCLIGVQAPEQLPSRALMANSLSIKVELLPPGKPLAQVMIGHLPDGGARISWLRDPDVVFYRVKRGTPETTDCHDPSGYRLLRALSRDIPGSALPLKLCSVAIDVIGQSSEFRTDLIQAAAP